MTAPRPVINVIDHLYRDVSIAEAARRGRFIARRRRARPRATPGLDQRRTRRRCRVADRVGQAVRRARPRPCLRADRRSRLPRRVGGPGRVVLRSGRRRCRRRRRVGSSPVELAVRLAVASPRRRRSQGCVPVSPIGWRRRIADDADTPAISTSPRIETTARSSCTRCWSSGCRLPERDPGLAAVRARAAGREPADRCVDRRRPPRMLDRLPLHRAALVPRRSRQRPRRRARTSRRLRRPHLAGARLRAAHPTTRRADTFVLRRRHRRLPSVAGISAPSCSTATTCAGCASGGTAGTPPAHLDATFPVGGYLSAVAAVGAPRPRPTRRAIHADGRRARSATAATATTTSCRSSCTRTATRWWSIRAATPTPIRRGGAGSRARRRTTPSPSTASTRRRIVTPLRRPAHRTPGSFAACRRPELRRHRGRGHQPSARGRAHPAGAVSAARVLGRARPPSR